MIYAIGDVHGQLEMLIDIHARIKADAAGRAHRVIHIGDLCDRGPDSRGVIEFIMQGQEAGENWEVVKGNHDRYLERFARDGVLIDAEGASGLSWLNPRLGGDKTLMSFGIDPLGNPLSERDKIPQNIFKWIEALPLMILTEKCAFVHAGVLPNTDFDEQVEQDLIWIREPFLSHHAPFGKLIIHGHTMVESIEHKGNRIDIDTGAGRFDPLSAIVIEDEQIFILSANGRIALTPPEGWSMFGEKI